ncbi:MAG: hypothetical protein ACLP9K_10035 [Nitrososphaerales archaeon]|jgi:hypothetical protein
MTEEARLKGSVSVGRKVAMPHFGSISLTFSQEFNLGEDSHEEVADILADKVRSKLKEWSVVTD